jgi:hypothetical protein
MVSFAGSMVRSRDTRDLWISQMLRQRIKERLKHPRIRKKDARFMAFL